MTARVVGVPDAAHFARLRVDRSTTTSRAGAGQIAWSGPSPRARPLHIKPLGEAERAELEQLADEVDRLAAEALRVRVGKAEAVGGRVDDVADRRLAVEGLDDLDRVVRRIDPE